MSITIGTIRKWEPAALDEAVRTLLKHRDALIALDDELTGCKPPASWRGAAADAAAPAHARIAASARRLTAEVAAVRTAAADAADSVEALRKSLAEAENLAKANGFTIADSGAVEDTDPPRNVPAGELDAVKAERRAVQLELVERVRELVRRGGIIDAGLAKVLGIARGDELRPGGTLKQAAEAGSKAGDLPITPPPNGKPGANAAWWESLSDADKTAVLKNHPAWIGNLDGVPAAFRDQANRARLKALRASVQEELDGSLTDELSTPWVYTDAEKKMAAIHAIDKQLAQGDRQLLLLDMSEEWPKAAVATGNVDTADHVAVQVPGMNSTVGGTLELKQGEMTRLHDEGKSVAGVTWIGYDSPNMPESLVNGQAEDGAADLARFFQGINASRDHDPHLTALGHSYGAVTTEAALKNEGTGVDDTVLFGGPGHVVDHVSELKVPAGSVYTLSADATVSLHGKSDFNNDIVEAMGSLFRTGELDGATELSTDAQGKNQPTNGHSAYLDAGTTSYENIKKIVTGEQDDVVE
ncbi:alpha/beta hydrolase [Saccharopolyspora sp. NPDC050642]|uniref:alpha/beta hydrolase n=1 Tax=Saccharopolyspora sp. NPDC050642 TaxID=3157099 RepID=UPI0034059D8E